MFKDHPSGTSHLDQMKDVSEPVFLHPYFETLADEGMLATARKVVNLFVGNCNESIVTKKYLDQAGNREYEIIAVDKTPPTNAGNEQFLEKALGERFQFITSDALEYLQSLAPDSVDLITSFGAEYVLPRDPRPQAMKRYLDEVARVLKIGGCIVSPALPFPGESQGFKQITSAIAQKIKE